MPDDPDARCRGDVRVPLQEAVAGGRVRCGVCARGCTLREGQRGFCGAREVRGGALVARSYGRISISEPRPMEIKPFFHYHPGEWALTVSSWGCDLACPWCQNHDLSRGAIPDGARPTGPAELVSDALYGDLGGLCVSFNEPATLLEYSLDLFREGRRAGLFGCWVTNGVITPAALRELASAGLDGLAVSVKGDAGTYARMCALPGGEEAAWTTVEGALGLGLHVEVVYLLVPGINDSPAQVGGLIERHLDSAGADTPLHLTRYHPAHRFKEPATPTRTVLDARARAAEAGVRYAYVGNVPGSKWENTYCPECKRLLMRRGMGRLLESRLVDGGRCECGERVPIRRGG